MKINKIFVIIAIVVLVIICILIALLYHINDGHIFRQGDAPISEDEIPIEEKVEYVSSRNNYFAVKSCIDKYFVYYSTIYDFGNDRYVDELSSADRKVVQQENAESLYDLLDSDYIEERKITKENILTKLKEMKSSTVDITNMCVAERSVAMSIYIVDGTIRQKESGKMEDFRMIVKLDLVNKTFTVIPSDTASKKYGDISIGDNINIECPEKIAKNENNIFNFEVINDEEYIKKLITQFKEEVVHNSELIYNNLNNEYKTNKFKTKQEFDSFIKSHLRQYVTLDAQSYQKTKTDNYTQYVIIDSKGNNYIFRETAPMKYTLILDTYTIELPEFTEKYNSVTNQEKVILNINKFMQSINDGDYRYAYNTLADSFKQNNFRTLEEFTNYVKANFFEKNKFDYRKFSNEADTYYTYEVDITDSNNTSKDVKTKTFIVLLEDGTDFKISFNL